MTTLLLDHYVKASDPINFKRLLEARNISETTALMIAVDRMDFPLIELLIRTGADVMAVDKNGNTALIRDINKNLSEKDRNPPKDLLSPFLLKVLSTPK